MISSLVMHAMMVVMMVLMFVRIVVVFVVGVGRFHQTTYAKIQMFCAAISWNKNNGNINDKLIFILR